MDHTILPDGSYSASYIRDYFHYIIKKHETVTENPLIKIYLNKIEDRITFRINTGCYLVLLTPETVKLLGSTKNRTSKNQNCENVSHLEITEVVLIHCDIANSDYQHESRVLYKFLPNKSFGQLLDISSKDFIFIKGFNSEFSYTEVWFTDQNSEPLEIEDKHFFSY